MESILNRYRCRQCGAVTYARLVHRGPDGAMGYADRYRCSGCSLTFSDPTEWHVQNGPTANAAQAPNDAVSAEDRPAARLTTHHSAPPSVEAAELTGD